VTAGQDPARGGPGQAAAAGHNTAVFVITAQTRAAMPAGAIAGHHHDVTARLLASTATAEGQQFARSYHHTAAMPIAGLRDRQRPVAPVAATLPDGTPHADPFLAARGWQARGGVYVRRPQPDLEAG
jgi:hypothetical protein